jgi:hypothetical protein
MGYDLFISRKIFVKDSNVDLSAYTKTKGKTLIVSENFLEFRGWDVSEIAQKYVTENTQELMADELIELYHELCQVTGQDPDKSIIDIMSTDYEQHTHYEDGGVFYELIQSY